MIYDEETETMLRELVGLAGDGRTLIWKPRQPRHFNTSDPAYACAGWNRKYAGKSVSLNRNKQFTVKRRNYTANTVVRMLGGTASFRYGIGIRGKVAGDLSPEQIKVVWRVGQDRAIVWRDRTPAAVKMLDKVAESIPSSRGRNAGAFNPESIHTFNARFAGKPVQPRRDGFVYTIGGVRARFTEICGALGVAPEATKAPSATRTEIPPVSDELIRKVFKLGDHNLIMFRERDAVTWAAMVNEGAALRIPEKHEIDLWNQRFAIGKRYVNPTSAVSIRIGKRTVSENRVVSVLKAADGHKNTPVPSNPYSF